MWRYIVCINNKYRFTKFDYLQYCYVKRNFIRKMIKPLEFGIDHTSTKQMQYFLHKRIQDFLLNASYHNTMIKKSQILMYQKCYVLLEFLKGYRAILSPCPW